MRPNKFIFTEVSKRPNVIEFSKVLMRPKEFEFTKVLMRPNEFEFTEVSMRLDKFRFTDVSMRPNVIMYILLWVKIFKFHIFWILVHLIQVRIHDPLYLWEWIWIYWCIDAP